MAKQNLTNQMDSLGNLFMQTRDIIKKQRKNLLLTGLIGLIAGIIGIILMIIAGIISVASGNGVVAGIVNIIFFIIIAIIVIIIYAFIIMITVKITKDTLDNKSINLKKLITETLNIEKIKPIATTGLLSGLMASLWSILLIIPGIWKSVQWTFAMIIATLTGKSNREALKESEKLVKGRRWLTLGYIACLGIALSIVQAIISGALGEVVGGLVACVIGVVTVIYLTLMYFERIKTASTEKVSTKEKK